MAKILTMEAQHPLESWLEKTNVTRTDFAKSIGCSLPHLSLLSQGKRGASLEIALNIERETKGAVTAQQLLDARREPVDE